jgi:DNA-binding protein YbaB
VRVLKLKIIMEKVEKLLGRKLNQMEKMIYEMQKDKEDYHFEKDKNGNLISIKTES